MKLADARKKIDAIDEQLVDLLVQRLAVSEEIGRIKAEQGLSIDDPEREQEVIERVKRLAEERSLQDWCSTALEKLWGHVLGISKDCQK